jgi:hypothetical protein
MTKYLSKTRLFVSQTLTTYPLPLIFCHKPLTFPRNGYILFRYAGIRKKRPSGQALLKIKY